MATPEEVEPTIVAADGKGNVYVVTDPSFFNRPGQNVILQFDSTGKYQGYYGNPSNFSSISGIAFDASNNMYVADSGSGVEKFDSNGNYLSQFGSAGSAPGDFAGPPGTIAFDHTGNVYVLDPHRYKVLVFDPNGTFLRQFGSKGRGNDQFTNPTGFALAQQNAVPQHDSSWVEIRASWGSLEEKHEESEFEHGGSFRRVLALFLWRWQSELDHSASLAVGNHFGPTAIRHERRGIWRGQRICSYRIGRSSPISMELGGGSKFLTPAGNHSHEHDDIGNADGGGLL